MQLPNLGFGAHAFEPKQIIIQPRFTDTPLTYYVVEGEVVQTRIANNAGEVLQLNNHVMVAGVNCSFRNESMDLAALTEFAKPTGNPVPARPGMNASSWKMCVNVLFSFKKGTDYHITALEPFVVSRTGFSLGEPYLNNTRPATVVARAG